MDQKCNPELIYTQNDFYSEGRNIYHFLWEVMIYPIWRLFTLLSVIVVSARRGYMGAEAYQVGGNFENIYKPAPPLNPTKRVFPTEEELLLNYLSYPFSPPAQKRRQEEWSGRCCRQDDIPLSLMPMSVPRCPRNDLFDRWATLDLQPRWLKYAKILGVCPWELKLRQLPPGSLPPHILDVKCTCDGQECSAFDGVCVSVNQTVSILGSNPLYQYFENVEVTIGCVCAQKNAPMANTTMLVRRVAKV